ncbi:MAG: hypothetical protein QME81_11205 [bacterium]|nr:hypothetical protein [bacterium]
MNERSHTICVRAKDAAGNLETSLASDTLVVAISPVSITLFNSTSSDYNDTNDITPTYYGQATNPFANVVLIQYMVEGYTSITWTSNGVDTSGPGTTVNFSFTISSGLNQGANTIRVRAKDEAAPNPNWGDNSNALMVDVTEPNTNLPDYTDTNDTTPTYYGEAKDSFTNIVDIKYQVEGATPIPWTDVDTFSLSKIVNFKFTTSALNEGSLSAASGRNQTNFGLQIADYGTLKLEIGN